MTLPERPSSGVAHHGAVQLRARIQVVRSVAASPWLCRIMPELACAYAVSCCCCASERESKAGEREWEREREREREREIGDGRVRGAQALFDLYIVFLQK